MYDTWKSSELIAACSKAAGVELEVVFDYQIGHLNFQLPPEMDGGTDEVALKNIPPTESPKQIDQVTAEDVEAAEEDLGTLATWQNDSYPWVCVVMLSDPSGILGETTLRKGDGELLKVKEHEKVGKVVMMRGA